MLNINAGSAATQVRLAQAMFERLPLVGMLLKAGDINLRMFETIVWRTDLIKDADILGVVDTQLAGRAPRWTALSMGKLVREVDRIVEAADKDAVRRRRERSQERDVTVVDQGDGLSWIGANLFSTDAHLLDRKLHALAATVCDQDPRTPAQRRADSLGALASGHDRLTCACGSPECAATAAPGAPNVFLHVIADRATVEGRGDKPGVLMGADELIPPELVAELAAQAKQKPVWDAMAAPAEPQYTPSAKLAEFVRYRDLTCRAPGCTAPADVCDVDHTVPHAKGGRTHATNLKCLCRRHHLLKTFWGWRDRQLADGTVIWTLPSGQTYVTTPGSSLLFPSMCTPAVDDLAVGLAGERFDDAGATTKMPRRTRTRAQSREQRVAAERRENRTGRDARIAARKRRHQQWFSGTAAASDPDGEPPPF